MLIHNTNIRIVIVISIAFFVVFSSLFVLQDIFPTPNTSIEKNEFFFREFDPDIKKIFIFGSSQTAALNTTHVIQKVTQAHDDYAVYNLGYDTDSPKKRLDSLQETINLKPKVVFYGVSFRDFTSDHKGKNYFDIQQLKNEFEPNVSVNPKIVTLQAIKRLFGDTASTLKTERKIIQPNTPFTELGPRGAIIVNENELKKQLAKDGIIQVDFSANNEQIVNFKKIISELKKNNIKVVLFTVPLPRTYLDSVPDSDKEELHTLLNDISKDFDVEFYDFTNRYEDLPIWSDLTHVAANPKAIIYSDDVAKMILQEAQ